VTLPVVLSSQAEADFDEADWYEKQAGLGKDFLLRVREVFRRIAATPLMHQVIYRDIRRSLVRRYPYSVMYRAEPDRITVVAVFDNRRDPAVWKSRV